MVISCVCALPGGVAAEGMCAAWGVWRGRPGKACAGTPATSSKQLLSNSVRRIFCLRLTDWLRLTPEPIREHETDLSYISVILYVYTISSLLYVYLVIYHLVSLLVWGTARALQNAWPDRLAYATTLVGLRVCLSFKSNWIFQISEHVPQLGPLNLIGYSCLLNHVIQWGPLNPIGYSNLLNHVIRGGPLNLIGYSNLLNPVIRWGPLNLSVYFRLLNHVIQWWPLNLIGYSCLVNHVIQWGALNLIGYSCLLNHVIQRGAFTCVRLDWPTRHKYVI